MRGSFHQNNESFSATTRGHQCFPIGVAALAYNRFIRNISLWVGEDLDYIVSTCDQILTNLLCANPLLGDRLEIQDLDTPFQLDGKPYLVRQDFTAYGNLNWREGQVSLYSLEEALLKLPKSCGSLVTLAGNTFVIMEFSAADTNQNDTELIRFTIFDSHSRCVEGILDPDGKSLVTYHNTLHSVAKHIRQFTTAVNAQLGDFMINYVRQCGVRQREETNTTVIH